MTTDNTDREELEPTNAFGKPLFPDSITMVACDQCDFAMPWPLRCGHDHARIYSREYVSSRAAVAAPQGNNGEQLADSRGNYTDGFRDGWKAHFDASSPVAPSLIPEQSIEFTCRVCGVQCVIAPDPPDRAVCPEHCEDHDYRHDRSRAGKFCIHCDQQQPEDWDDD